MDQHPTCDHCGEPINHGPAIQHGEQGPFHLADCYLLWLATQDADCFLCGNPVPECQCDQLFEDAEDR